jgi:phage tail protein X
MADFYKSRDGDTIDLICWRHYGKTDSTVELVYKNNPDLAKLDLVIPIGTEIYLPDVQDIKVNQFTELWD